MFLGLLRVRGIVRGAIYREFEEWKMCVRVSRSNYLRFGNCVVPWRKSAVSSKRLCKNAEILRHLSVWYILLINSQS